MTGPWRKEAPSLAWERTPDGWALNLDGTGAAREFTLPRLELHSGPRGWTGICHLPGGKSLAVQVGRPTTAAAAQRAAVEAALPAVGAEYHPALRALL